MVDGVIETQDFEGSLEPDYSDAPTPKGIKRIIELMGSNNIADEIEQWDLDRIGKIVMEEYMEDESSLEEWRKDYKKGLELAKQTHKTKTFPWEGASNVQYPLVGNAALKFNARAFPEIVQGDKIVKAKVIGKDQQNAKADRAERISDFMSYQLLEQVPNWTGDTDKLLMMLPIVGVMFKEVIWNEIDDRPDINLLMPDELVVNYHTKSLDLSKSRRISKEVTMFKNDIIERERADLWLEISYVDEGDEDAIEDDEQVFIQQLRYLDLDDDGYDEPYMVTVHKESSKVVRIIANYALDTVKYDNETGEVQKIEPYKIYTDYHFIRAFDGSFYSLGYGQYLYTTNMSINTIMNQIIDSGTLHNTQAGFLAKGMRSRMGSKPFQPGEFRPVDTKGMELKNSIVLLPTKEPSMVLYQTLLYLIDMGKEMSSTTDVLAGVPQGANTPVGTTLAMIDEGMKVIDAVYKRIYGSLRKEFKMLYRLNSIYLTQETYQNVLDNDEADFENDFNQKDFDILPVGDSRISSQVMRTMKAQAARDIVASTPGANLPEASRNVLKSMDVSDVDALIPEGPNAEELMPIIEGMKGKLQYYEELIQSGQLELQIDENTRENQESNAKVTKDMASAVNQIADAESKEAGDQLAEYTLKMQQAQQFFEMIQQQKEALNREREQIQQRREVQPVGQGIP